MPVVVDMIPCAREGCGELFIPYNSRQRYCTRECRMSDPEFKVRQRAYVKKHRDKPETKAKRSTPEARAKANAWSKARYQTAEYQEWLKAYYARPDIQERKLEQERINRETKRDDYRRRAREYGKKLRQDPQFRIKQNMSTLVYQSLKRRKNGSSWEALVGYTREQLVRHLERQFTKDMSWDNYGRGIGKWHIDHIRAWTTFKFESPNDPEFRACWALSNLRPLFWDANIRKGNKRELLL